MDKVNHAQARATLLLAALLLASLASCRSIESVRITNQTSRPIDVVAYFESARGGSNQLEFSLKAGASDLWQYEVGKLRQATIDPNFRALEVDAPPGCSLRYGRKEIEENFTRNGMWNVTIEDASLTCDRPTHERDRPPRRRGSPTMAGTPNAQ